MGMCARCVVGLGVAILAGGLGCESSHHASSSTSMDPDTAHVMDILAEAPLIDGHNDVPWQYRRRVHNHLDEIDFASDTTDLDPPMHTDIPRLRAGGVGAIQSAMVIGALPFSAVMVLMCVSLVKAIVKDGMMYVQAGAGVVADVLAVEGDQVADGAVLVRLEPEDG